MQVLVCSGHTVLLPFSVAPWSFSASRGSPQEAKIGRQPAPSQSFGNHNSHALPHITGSGSSRTAAFSAGPSMQVVCDLWVGFSSRFLELWSEAGPESLVAAPVFGSDAPARAATQTAFMRELLADALRFAGCCMVRRLVGIAHNADFERIEDVETKAVCEARGLRLGRRLLLECRTLQSIEAVVQAAREERCDGKQPCRTLPEGV